MKNLLNKYILICVLLMFVIGCAAKSRVKQQGKNEVDEALSALESITESLTGKEMDEKQRKEMIRQLRKDEEAQSAIKKIGDAIDNKNIKIKYSPKTGKRYSLDMEYCPDTGVKLLPLE